MVNCTERERIEILMMIGYGDRKRTFDEVRYLFNNKYPERPPIAKSTVCKILQKFNETGEVKDAPRSGRSRTATNNEKSLEILLDIQENPKTSTFQLAQNHNISRSSVQTILHKQKYHPYKIQLVQELLEDDFDRRLEFCERITNEIEMNEHFLDFVVFSDEATFCLNGSVNRHNSRYWADSNPYWMEETHTQYPEKINVWAGITVNHLIGPFFIEGTLTGRKYLELLQDHIIPSIRNFFPNGDIYFQQDGAPPHYTRAVRELLNNTFPGRWIGRRGGIEWPSRSPDLSPLDFFLWGYLKNRVYINRPLTREDLKIRIQYEMQAIPVNYLQRSFKNFEQRLYYCQEVNGNHFEHLI